MQFRDLRAQYSVLKQDIDSGIQEVLNETSFILGDKVRILEEELARYVGRKYCVTCGNGTDALQLSLMAYDIGRGDAIFTSDFTYFASAGCASIIGAEPIFVDIDKRTFNIDPDMLERMVCSVIADGKYKPKAIIPVDLFGLPADYERIISIAEKYGMIVLEDAAQGFGGEFNGKRACSFGQISATSFFPAKPLGCYGDGGAIFTDDDNIASRLRSLRSSGKSPYDKYDNREIGMNSRLDTIQAAILLTKLDAFKKFEVANINRIAERYSLLLKKYVEVPFVPDKYISSWAQYTILLKNKEQRDYIKNELNEKGIPSMVYYPRGLHEQAAYAYKNLYDAMYVNTIDVTNRCLSLPIHPYLTDADQDDVVNSLVLLLANYEGEKRNEI